MLVRMPRLDDDSEQAADLAGGQPDQVIGAGPAVVIMLAGCPGKLSTGAGAPFEPR
jgi:hypothetical protein